MTTLYNGQSQARLKPKRCLDGFIFTLNNNKILESWANTKLVFSWFFMHSFLLNVEASKIKNRLNRARVGLKVWKVGTLILTNLWNKCPKFSWFLISEASLRSSCKFQNPRTSPEKNASNSGHYVLPVMKGSKCTSLGPILLMGH